MLEPQLPQNPSKRTYSKMANCKHKVSCLFALQSSHKRYQENKDNLIGIVDILDGLEHHYKKIKNHERAGSRRLIKIDKSKDSNGKPFEIPKPDLRRENHWPASHEAGAYMTLIGKLSIFFQSEWFKEYVDDSVIASKIPSVLALQPIRNKCTAHRQQDDPRNDDCSSLGLHQYGLTHLLACPIGKPEAVQLEYQFPTKQRHYLLKKYHPAPVQGIECLGNKNNIVIFIPTNIHSKVLKETISLLEHFFDF